MHFQAETDHVSTHGVLDLSDRVSFGKIAYVPRIFKMVE